MRPRFVNMATKNAKKENIKKDDVKYFYAVGKRKTAIAQVRIYPVEKSKDFSVNDRKLEKYFTIPRHAEAAKAPLVATGQEEKFDVSVHIIGGGINAQSEAVRLGVARAILKYDESFRKALRDLGYLTRDSRMVERKKPGLKKARRAPQWAKR